MLWSASDTNPKRGGAFEYSDNQTCDSQPTHDPRTDLVEWSQEARALVFRGTGATLADFWTALCEPAGKSKGYIDRYPEVGVDRAFRVIELTRDIFCSWPDSDEEQARARSLPDPPLRGGRERPRPRRRSLTFKGTRIRFEILWSNLLWDEEFESMPLDRIADDYRSIEPPRSERSR